jgi:L-threonylcarbamoyladenylate synthase
MRAESGDIPKTAEMAGTHTPALFRLAVERAAHLLKSGQVVALPTETVYGLAANAFDPAAVAKIYAAKDRPATNPLIVHIASGDMAADCVSAWPAAADRLASAFWPGPLTIVVPKAARIPSSVTAGGSTVALRWPSHPLVQAVIRACGFPLAAPSANRANQISPTTAQHVWRQLGDRIPLVVDGGPCQVGIESTVVDVTVTPARLLRPGMIHEESLTAVLGEIQSGDRADAIRRSPGQFQKHYAPKARLIVRSWKTSAEFRDIIDALGGPTDRIQVLAHDRIPQDPGAVQVSVIPHEPDAYARAMYAEWHRCDECGVGIILVEDVPATGAWRAIADRLRRAAAGE